MEMNYCLEECHDGKVIKNDCEVCHTDSFVKENKEPSLPSSDEENNEEEQGENSTQP